MFVRSRRWFLGTGIAAALGYASFRWMSEETWAALVQRKNELLRSTLEFNEKVSQFFYRPSRLAPEFPPSRISQRRVNGMIGIDKELDAEAWTLNVGGLFGRTDDLVLTLDDIKSLPRTEMITELKCIEGWSIIVQWAGVRFSDFAAKYLPNTIDGSRPDVAGRPEKLVPYVSLSTPDNGYFVGWDMPSILHPQTLLAYEMNGAPLLPEHGAPLRLASPTKYGIKLLKRIGRIEFTAERPRDYWAESGYDWYSGH
ncbi:MAG: molybdopterin-dependent oxidoreductase [Acidobacteria bacterium]|nr:molybdopterin-dependent oxidoreductase [Acidobacteriota bacterium]